MATTTIDNMPRATELSKNDVGHFAQSGIDKGATLETLGLLLMKQLNPAGKIFPTSWATIPTGFRGLFLQGDGVLVSAYPELVTNCYCGDSANATADSFYRATDSAGTTRSITGDYFILADFRGYTPRGLDTTGLKDEAGASRILGSEQDDAMQRITGSLSTRADVGSVFSDVAKSGVFGEGTTRNNSVNTSNSVNASDLTFDSADSVSPNTAKTTDTETRVKNIAVNYVITY